METPNYKHVKTLFQKVIKSLGTIKKIGDIDIINNNN